MYGKVDGALNSNSLQCLRGSKRLYYLTKRTIKVETGQGNRKMTLREIFEALRRLSGGIHFDFLLLVNISFVAATFLFLFLPLVNPSQRLKLEECWSHVMYVCTCARANPQLAAALNEPSEFGMHRSLLLCALQQALERKW